MGSSHEDGIPADSIHENACAGLNIIKMNVSILGDEVYNVMLLADLETTRKIRANRTLLAFTIHREKLSEKAEACRFRLNCRE